MPISFSHHKEIILYDTERAGGLPLALVFGASLLERGGAYFCSRKMDKLPTHEETHRTAFFRIGK